MKAKILDNFYLISFPSTDIDLEEWKTFNRLADSNPELRLSLVSNSDGVFCEILATRNSLINFLADLTHCPTYTEMLTEVLYELERSDK